MKNDENKVVLHEKLQEVLDLVGTSPLDEPKIFEAIDVEQPRKTEAIKIAFARKDLDLDLNTFDAKEIANFYNQMRQKIISLKDDDGVYKATPNTKSYKFPNFEEVEQLSNLGVQLSLHYKTQSQLEDDNEDALAKCQDDIISVLNDMDVNIWSITGLDKDKLTAWEVQLVSEQIFKFATDVEFTSMGKPLNI